MRSNTEQLEMIRQDLKNYLSLSVPDFSCDTAVILGSGLGEFGQHMHISATLAYQDIPHFKTCSVGSHVGNLLLGHIGNRPIVCMQGRLHWYESCDEQDFHVPFLLMQLLGVERIFITNASGAINPDLTPGNLVLITDHINFQFRSPLMGLKDPNSRHFLDLHNAYDQDLSEMIKQSAQQLDIPLQEGIYVGVLGPNFETPAEIRAYGRLGADLVGMSTVPEVITANYYGIKVGAISIISNMAAGLTGEMLSHELTLFVAQQSTKQLTQLIQQIICQPVKNDIL